MDLKDVIFIVEQDKYMYFEDYLLSMNANVRLYPYTINKGEKVIVMQRLLHMNYHDAAFVGLLNTEQLTRHDELMMYEKYKLDDIKIHFFDYSMTNILILKGIGIEATHLPYAYNEEEMNKLKSMISNNEKKYDFAIVGAENGRRLDMVNKLRSKGFSVLVVQGWRDARDQTIATCKYLLNIHYNEHYMVFEELRCNRWLMAGMIVISESSIYDMHAMNQFNNLKIFHYDTMDTEVATYLNKRKNVTNNVTKDITSKGIVRDNLKIGVAIPTYKNDIIWLKRCLDSIEQQVLKPTCVAISASSCKEEDIPNFHYSFPIMITTTTNAQNAAMNRNIAASLLKDVDIISFFDSDDEMTPYRLKYIIDSFVESPCDFVVHNYTELTNYSQLSIIDNNEYIAYPNSVVPNNQQYGVMAVKDGNMIGNLTHGHISVSSVLWKNEQFNITSSWEDSEYVRRLVNREYIGNYINTILSIYHNYNTSAGQLYNLVVTCKNNNQHIDAYRYLMEAFVYINPLYDYMLYYELSIIAYYINQRDLGLLASEKIMNNPNAPEQMKQVVQNNLYYYK